MHIWLGMLIPESLLPAIWSLFQGEQCHGNQDCRNVLLCRPQRLRILLSPNLARSYCGWRSFYKNWVYNKKGIYSTVIVKVLFISVRIQLFILDPSILMWDIIGFVMHWKQNCFALRKSILMRMDKIWWQNQYLQRSYNYVESKWAW